MKVKKRLQRSPKQFQANKIQAINALYGSFGTLENMKRAARQAEGTTSINSAKRRAQKTLKQNDSTDLEFADIEVPLPSSSHVSRDESSTKLPILPRHLAS